MNILSSLCAFSFAGIPMAIGTVGSFFSIGGIYDERQARLSTNNRKTLESPVNRGSHFSKPLKSHQKVYFSVLEMVLKSP